MAKGDTVSAIANIAAATEYDFQPAAGVEVVIVECGTESGLNDMHVGLHDGVDTTNFGAASARFAGKLFIRNGLYLRIYNANGGAQDMAYTGIQVK
jgi:hypothetical protein